MDGTEARLGEIAALYTDTLTRHGTTSKAVGWRDEATHRLRFDKLTQGLIAEGEAPFTVNDLGAGYGALFRYLDGRYGARLARYHGYEISDAMLEACRQALAGDARAEVVRAAEPAGEADYSFVCGSFNVKFAAADAEWDAYVKDMLLRLGRASRRGLAFNLLTSYVDWKEPHLFYADPGHYFDFCKRNLSRRVALLHDYPLYEWTITVTK